MKIEVKKNCREGGTRSWFIATCDFSSLQVRLAAIDTAFQSKNGLPDPVLYDVYKEGSDKSDLHSMTGWKVFNESCGLHAIKVHDDVDGKDYVFAPTSRVKVELNGKQEEVLAKDLKPEHHILEHL